MADCLEFTTATIEESFLQLEMKKQNVILGMQWLVMLDLTQVW